MRLITVFACESQPMAIEGLRVALEASAELLLAGAADPEHALPGIARTRPRVTLIGPAEESEAVLGFVEQVLAVCPETAPVLWLRRPESVGEQRALACGVRAILRRTHPAGILLECLRTVGQGGFWREADRRIPSLPRSAPRLTPREREVLRLLCRGWKNRQIAEALAISPGTVKVHLMHLFEKTGARNRYELALGARRLVEPQPELPASAPGAEEPG